MRMQIEASANEERYLFLEDQKKVGTASESLFSDQ